MNDEDVIRERQSQIDTFVAQLPATNVAQAVEHAIASAERFPQTQSDDEVIARAEKASNGQLFRKLFEMGDWQTTGYPSQSEADFALIDLIEPVTTNDEQLERLFHRSPLGRRGKAHRRNYIAPMIAKARAGGRDKFAHINTSGLIQRGAAHLAALKPSTIASDFLTADEVLAQTEQPAVIEELIPQSGTAYLYGDSGAGKSFIAFPMMDCIASGLPFFGYETMQTPVVYVMQEGQGGLKARIAAFEKHHGRKFAANVRFYTQPFDLTKEDQVIPFCNAVPRGCVIFLDTLAAVTPGIDENSFKDMSRVIAMVTMMKARTGGTVIIIAHTGKDASKDARGHSSQRAAADTMIRISRDGDARYFTITKSKDGRDGIAHPFRLHVVELGRNARNKVISSCVAIGDSANSAPAERPLTGAAKLAWETFKETATDDGTSLGVHFDTWRIAFERKSLSATPSAMKRAFQRAREELVERGMLTHADRVYRVTPEHRKPDVSAVIEAGRAKFGCAT